MKIVFAEGILLVSNGDWVKQLDYIVRYSFDQGYLRQSEFAYIGG